MKGGRSPARPSFFFMTTTQAIRDLFCMTPPLYNYWHVVAMFIFSPCGGPFHLEQQLSR